MNDLNRYREEEQEMETQETVQPEEPKAQVEEDHNRYREEEEDTTESQLPWAEREQELTAEVERLADQLLRNRAELENFKRRLQEERIRDRKYAMQDFFGEFILLTDIFDQAVQTPTEDERLKKFLTGFAMINQQMQQLLANYGVKKIETNKMFDPALHTAHETLFVEGLEDGAIVDEIITGYYYKDRVLRPSVVRVNKINAKQKEEEKNE